MTLHMARARERDEIKVRRLNGLSTNYRTDISRNKSQTKEKH